jgi:sugar-specific transcriptional regulator TrmB
MNFLVRELIQPILEDFQIEMPHSNKVIALFGGGFKPPTKGHFDVVKQILKDYPSITEFQIVIGGGIRDGITPEMSMKIWESYKPLLSDKVKLVSSTSPLTYIKDYIKENSDTEIYAVVGTREGDEQDAKDFEQRKALYKRYGNKVNVIKSESENSISGTKARKALSNNNFEAFINYLPNELDSSTQQQIWNILGKDQIKEMSQVAIQSVEDFADKELNPLDIEFTSHFFDRLVDPRNIKPISSAELIGFFKRLAKKKKQLFDFLSKYKEIVATDNRTDINIPLVKQSNTAIAKTIMRKKDFKTPDPKIEFNENLNESVNNSFDDALDSLIRYMVNQGMNIHPLPSIKIIDNDVENSNNVLGKTAYYDPNNCSITLYTLNRHPKDILRSFSHEMVHRIQDNEGRLNNINTTNTNEDGDLPELEREAYLNGNMTFRNWEDSLKNNTNEWIVDIPKYNYTPKLSNKIFSQLYELKVNEITLNPNNAVETYGDLNNGDFTVGEYDYNYRIIKLDKNPYNSNSFYSIDFHEIGNKNPNPSLPTKNARENYIKILSTIYKIILDFTKEEKPEYIGISSLDESGYGNIYNNLTKTNKLPGYSRKDSGLDFTSKSGEKGKFIVLKRTDV